MIFATDTPRGDCDAPGGGGGPSGFYWFSGLEACALFPPRYPSGSSWSAARAAPPHAGIPYWIFYVLPRMFPDKLPGPGGYAGEIRCSVTSPS